VADSRFANSRRVSQLFNKTSSYLNSLDPAFPKIELNKREIDIMHGYCGRGYAFFTETGMDAVRRMASSEGIKLDGTYTGKTFAALIDVAREQSMKDKVLLFWNTYNSRDFSEVIAGVHYTQLPRCFHRYFEEDVQSLDKQAGKTEDRFISYG